MPSAHPAASRTDIDYVLMGGIGTATLARPRSTDDIDVFVTPDHRLALVDLGMVARVGRRLEHLSADGLAEVAEGRGALHRRQPA